jgi:ferredoxin
MRVRACSTSACSMLLAVPVHTPYAPPEHSCWCWALSCPCTAIHTWLAPLSLPDVPAAGTAVQCVTHGLFVSETGAKRSHPSSAMRFSLSSSLQPPHSTSHAAQGQHSQRRPTSTNTCKHCQVCALPLSACTYFAVRQVPAGKCPLQAFTRRHESIHRSSPAAFWCTTTALLAAIMLGAQQALLPAC